MLWQAVHESEGKPLTPGQWMVHEMSVRSGGRSAGFPADAADAAIGCPPFHGDGDEDDEDCCCCCCCGNSAVLDDFLCPFCFDFEIGVMVMLGEFVRWAGRPAGTALAAGPPPAGEEDCGVKGRFLDAIAAVAVAVEPLRRGLGCAAPCCFGCW